MPIQALRGLSRLARLHGIQTSYYDLQKKRQHATPQSLIAILAILGEKVATDRDVEEAIARFERDYWARGIEPVTVSWEGKAARAEIRTPTSAGTTAACALMLDDGGEMRWTVKLTNRLGAKSASVEATRYTTRTLELPKDLPIGYHSLEIHLDGRELNTIVVCAPGRAFCDIEWGWGIFLPLYALRTDNTLGNGDITDLRELSTWASHVGADIVGTLPLLANFLEEPFEPSPYSPASRLFWNELYVDPRRSPHLEGCTAAREGLASPELRAEFDRLRALPALDYKATMKARRLVLEPLAVCAAAESKGEFAKYLRKHPRVNDYARFRATVEKQRTSWHSWPARLREGTITPIDYDDDARKYHAYVQWLAHRQLSAVAAESDAMLYLDLPLGVHRDGYDVWRERDLFAIDASAGAPPDPFFTRGQQWGFPPMKPEALRANGYAYFRECLRNMMQYAGVLRLDHVMSLHRLFWVPQGHEATDGAYVRYNADEFYATLCIESERHRCVIVGEDLGVVPAEVRPAMARHNVQRMAVVQFDANAGWPPLGNPPHASVASLNTHDMPTFAAYWNAEDVEDRQDLGLLDDNGAARARNYRRGVTRELARFFKQTQSLKKAPESSLDALRAALLHLAQSDARFVLINLEDLWLETKPQNVPGTWRERPNWRRKARYTLEEARELADVKKTLRIVAETRAEKKS
jgi:4-alpha-glucanotransferase